MPSQPAPPDMAWWAVHAHIGEPVLQFGADGKIIGWNWPVKQNGYVLGRA